MSRKIHFPVWAKDAQKQYEEDLEQKTRLIRNYISRAHNHLQKVLLKLEIPFVDLYIDGYEESGVQLGDTHQIILSRSITPGGRECILAKFSTILDPNQFTLVSDWDSVEFRELLTQGIGPYIVDLYENPFFKNKPVQNSSIEKEGFFIGNDSAAWYILKGLNLLEELSDE